MAEPTTGRRQPGLREVLILALAVVAVVLGLAAATSLLPAELQRVVFDTPLLIGVLIVGTGWWLWRVVAAPARPTRAVATL